MVCKRSLLLFNIFLPSIKWYQNDHTEWLSEYVPKKPKEKIVMSLYETYSMHEFCKRYFVKYNEKSLDISSMQYWGSILWFLEVGEYRIYCVEVLHYCSQSFQLY